MNNVHIDIVSSFPEPSLYDYLETTMFIGHFALAFGAKKFAPRVSLGILFLACQLADIIWPNLVLLGIEALEVEPGITVMTPLDFLHRTPEQFARIIEEVGPSIAAV